MLNPAEKTKKRYSWGSALFTQRKLNKLRALFSPNDKLLIVIKPDPDSIASALALRALLAHDVKQIVIAREGKINRLENIAMVNLLKIKMEPVETIRAEDFTRHATVDGQPGMYAYEIGEYDVVIDHHPLNKETIARFKDVRPRYGATSTIMTEYLMAARRPISTRLATALCYGVKTDTNNFERDTLTQDVLAFRFLFHRANKNLLRKIDYSKLSLYNLIYFKRAIENLKLVKGKIFVHIGEVTNPDICVQLADFLVRVNDISWAIVSAISEGKLIIVFRNDGYRKDAGKIAAQAFGSMGSAGGHRSAARAEVPIEALKGKARELTQQAIESFIIRKIQGKGKVKNEDSGGKGTC